jgi:hypothetical protein
MEHREGAPQTPGLVTSAQALTSRPEGSNSTAQQGALEAPDAETPRPATQRQPITARAAARCGGKGRMRLPEDSASCFHRAEMQ